MSIQYAASQFANALNGDPTKLARWKLTIENMLSGAVSIGSRQPTDFPVWATPEVLHGGFTTGRMLAGLDLADHERKLVAELDPDAPQREPSTRCADGRNKPLKKDRQDRQAIQMQLTQSASGVQYLAYVLRSRRYHIQLPEEGALLVYAWLCDRGHVQLAQELRQAVAPYFDRLCFHPSLLDHPRDISRVSKIAIAQLVKKLDFAQEWLPVKDHDSARDVGRRRLQFWEAVANLWLSTLDNPQCPPTGAYAEGPQSDRPTKRFHIDPLSAWPCQKYPTDWASVADGVLDLHRQYSKAFPPTSGSFYTKMTGLIKLAQQDPRSLTGKDVGWIRWFLATSCTKRGAPGSERHRRWVTNTERCLCPPKHNPRPFYDELKRILLETFSNADTSTGFRVDFMASEDVDRLVAHMTHHFPGHKKLRSLPTFLKMAWGMNFDELFTSGVVSSPDAMANLLTPFTAAAASSRIIDDDAQYLYHQIQAAFFRRRSLLLLDYASQVKINELPWIQCLERALIADKLVLESTDGVRNNARAIVGRVFRYFGELPMRNEFLGLLRVLFRNAEIDCPTLEGLAADIFMGNFVDKYGEAHAMAKSVLKGTCYDRYYALHSHEGIPFAEICRQRVASGPCANRAVKWLVSNGMTIEQAEILTTHNMVTLFKTLELETSVADLSIPNILERSWQQILRKMAHVRRLSNGPPKQQRLAGPVFRDIGFLWRQMMFWLSILEKYQPTFFVVATSTLEQLLQSTATRSHLALLQQHQDQFADLLVVLRDPHARPTRPLVYGWQAPPPRSLNSNKTQQT